MSNDSSSVLFSVHLSDPVARIQDYLDSYRTEDACSAPPTFDAVLLRKNIKIVSATASPACTAVYEVEVVEEMCSKSGNLHGGAAAMIIDMCTTMAMAPIARRDFWWFGGVSRKLDATSLRPVIFGRTVRVECEVVQIGRALATLHAKIRWKSNGVILCFGSTIRLPLIP